MSILKGHGFIAKKSKLLWFSIIFITISLIYFARNMPTHSSSFWHYFNEQTDIYMLTVIFVITYIFNIQDNERDLLNYTSVYRVYIYRFINYVIVFLFITVYSLIIAAIVGSLLWTETIGNPNYNGTNLAIESLYNFLLGSLTAIQFILIAYVIKTIIDNKLSILLFIIFFLGGNLITSLGSGLFAQYSLFTNFDLAQFSNRDIIVVNNLTLLGSITKNIIYLIFILYIGFEIFKIKANGRMKIESIFSKK